MRINKYLAAAGVSSRRGAEKLIADGVVKINGVAAELGSEVDEERDTVTVNGRKVKPASRSTYLMLHKPKGCVTTRSDEKGRKTVFDFVDIKSVRLFTVGRLDYDTEGLLLMTNDGDLSYRLTHPGCGVGKTYSVRIEGSITEGEIEQLRQGVDLGEGERSGHSDVKTVSTGEDGTRLEITIYEGKNRQIRRMLEAISKKVIFLKRTAIGDLRLGGLGRGQYRFLSDKEIEYLKSL